MQKTQAFIAENKDRFLEELMDLLRIASISADPAYKDQVNQMAAATKIHLEKAGCDVVTVYATKCHPIVYAEKIINPELPTILVYGHYDVQPPDPLELWDSPPFEPIIKKTKTHPDGAIFARGSCDDKGQFFMHVKAFEAMNKNGEQACNIKFLIEGEEEMGSDNLEEFCHTYSDMLACDVILISDTSIIANDTPSITSGLRGLSYVEVEVTGPNKDLHSGVYGGAVANPVNVLCQMIASLHDDDHKIVIPGFYDRVIDLDETEREAINSAPFDESAYRADLEIDAVAGENGYSTLERASTRPTLDVNGIWGGYIGEGAKTVLPSKAFAKISMRLVPDQDPDEITKLFANHFKAIAPASVKVEVRPHHGGHPALTPTDSIEYAAAAQAMEQTFGKIPIPSRGGGSIPIVSLFEQTLSVKTVLMGFGLDSDDIHSPNEHYGLFNFFKGIETIPYFHHHFAALKKG